VFHVAYHRLMWPTGYATRWRASAGSGPASVGPAMTTLRSVIAYLASMIRFAGLAYVVVQVVIWHSFYTDASFRLLPPALAVAWGVTVAAYLRRHWPSPFLACVDSAVYVVLALGTQACVPPAVRDSAFSWLVISMSGQLMIPAWYAPGVLSVLLALSSPLAYWAGAALQPVTDIRTVTGAGILLLVVGLAHRYGRRVLYARAAVADADVERAGQAAREQYAILCRNIERRENERLLHDTVLNTLTALARADAPVAEVVTRCRQDVALIEAALGGADDLAVDSAGSPGDLASDDLVSEVRAVAAGMRDRGLTVHLEVDDEGGAAIPARVSTAVSNAVREALLNVAAHAGTGEAWVGVRRTVPDGGAEVPGRLRVVVRDRGIGFDRARVDQARLGLRRSITERIAECGGQASIRSAPGQGTEVSLSWPAPERPDVPAQAGYTLADHGLVQEGLPW
jgi:signal transduction histidine kinase